MVEKYVVFGGKGHIFIPIVSLTNNLRSHYTFNASCFGMVSFSYVTATKSAKYWTLLIGLFLMSPRDKNLSSRAHLGQANEERPIFDTFCSCDVRKGHHSKARSIESIMRSKIIC